MADIDVIIFDVTQFYTSVNPYWIPVRSGIRQASQMSDVSVKYHTPDCSGGYDYSQINTDMERLLKNVAKQSPKGIILALPNLSYQKEIVQDLLNRNVPVVILNPVREAPFSYTFSVGSDKWDEGYLALEKLKLKDGESILYCRNYKQGVSDIHDERVQGIKHYLAENKLSCKFEEMHFVVGSEVDNPQRLYNAITKKKPDVVMCANVQTSSYLVNTLHRLGSEGKECPEKSCCFDLSMEVLRGIEDGIVTCAVDQQPFLMGYLSVTMLGLYMDHGIRPFANLPTGPFIIDKSNISETLLKFSQKR